MTSRQPTSRTIAALTIASAALLTVPAHDARACGCGALPDGLTAAHPRSIAVAFAVREAIDAGLIDQPAARAGSASAVLRLSTFHRWLADSIGGPAGDPVPMSLLLIDSGLTHATGIVPGVIIVTHESVLTAILERRLSMAAALDRGLLVLDGPAAEAASLRQRLAESPAEPSAPTVRR